MDQKYSDLTMIYKNNPKNSFIVLLFYLGMCTNAFFKSSRNLPVAYLMIFPFCRLKGLILAEITILAAFSAISSAKINNSMIRFSQVFLNS